MLHGSEWAHSRRRSVSSADVTPRITLCDLDLVIDFVTADSPVHGGTRVLMFHRVQAEMRHLGLLDHGHTTV